MRCAQCNNSVPDGATFCGQCGNRMESVHGDSGVRPPERRDLQKTRAMPERIEQHPEFTFAEATATSSHQRGIGRQRRHYPTDIVILMDCTSSMTPYIEGMKDMTISLSRDLEANDIDARLGLVEFRDVKIGERTRVHGFAQTPEEFRSWIARLTASGGGDEPESAIDAGYSALDEMVFRENAAKVLAWITDASYHEPAENGRTMDDLIREIVSRQILAYVIGPDLPGYIRLTECMKTLFFDIQKNPDGFRQTIKKFGKSITETVPRMRDMRSAADEALGRTRAW